ncbi:MAG: nodulation protein NodH [Rhodobacteraceae bacterium]|nr:nodulation protein NodH [Paracoccaceae bacterium]
MAAKFKSFVLLANMRTGSNLFEQNIRLYPEFSCHGELFNSSFIGFPDVHNLYGTSMSEREKKPHKLLERLLETETNTLPGFRLFAGHDHRILESCLADPECAKIVLTRNPLDSFVSHAIARATDQWKLTDVSKRKKEKINFDIIAFKSYLNKIQTFLSEIKLDLQRTGQTAFYLNYEDLNNVDVFNGLATFLGGAVPLKELDSKIVRQNPEGMQDKVHNFAEMQEQVGRLDLLGTEAVPVLEPIRNPGSKNFKGGNKLPVLFMPMHKSEFPEVTTWMAAHEKQMPGGEQLNVEMNQNQLGHWLRTHSIRQTFTVVTHPVERAYDAFYRHIFCAGDDLFPWIRTTLENHYNVTLPDKKLVDPPNRSVLENSGYGVDHHRQAFTKFLRFVKGNLQGLTRSRVDQSWASQNSILQGYCRLVFPDVILRKENLTNALREMERDIGLSSIPVGAALGSSYCFDLHEIYCAEMEEIARATYTRDYQMFGFQNWE